MRFFRLQFISYLRFYIEVRSFFSATIRRQDDNGIKFYFHRLAKSNRIYNSTVRDCRFDSKSTHCGGLSELCFVPNCYYYRNKQKKKNQFWKIVSSYNTDSFNRYIRSAPIVTCISPLNIRTVPRTCTFNLICDDNNRKNFDCRISIKCSLHSCKT